MHDVFDSVGFAAAIEVGWNVRRDADRYIGMVSRVVAAGAGGAYVNCRVQATGVVECAFLGPLASGSVPFNFNRSN